MKITLLQLHGLPWQMRSHLAMMHEHLSTYEAEVDGIKITKSVHIINEEYLKYGRNYTHYMIRGDSSIYKTHKSVVNAITNFRERRKEMIAELIGWIATVFRASGMIAKRASLVKWLVSVGNLFWLISGIISRNAPLIASNAICLVAFGWEVAVNTIRKD